MSAMNCPMWQNPHLGTHWLPTPCNGPIPHVCTFLLAGDNYHHYTLWCTECYSKYIKGRLLDILGFFWSEWICLGLNRNRCWFLNFEDNPLIWDRYFQFWCISCQTFSGILRILERDRQLGCSFLRNFIFIYFKRLGDMLMLLKNVFEKRDSVANPSPRFLEYQRKFTGNASNIKELSKISVPSLKF
jgi:hypothetical protein